MSGVTLLPIGTLYDPFVPRGLDALYHALYSGASFLVVATPSGVSLAPEGGAHQSVITPGIGVALPAIAYFEPAFAREVEWILLDALRGLADRTGTSVYLRLSTKPVDQSLAPPPSPEYRACVLRGGYRLIDARGEPQVALGVDDFGQSGARAALYRHYGIDAAAIVQAATVLLGG